MTQPSTETLSTKHPQALLPVSLCYALYMWAFSAIIATLTLYLTTLPKVNTQTAYTIYAIYASMLWILPVIGGFISEKIGFIQAALVGLTICIIALCFLYFHDVSRTLIGLSLFLVGNGFFTPSLWCIVDHLYHKQDMRREAGFTLFYLIFNIGAVLGIFISSYIRIRYSYSIEFGSCTLALLAALLLLWHSKLRLTLADGRSISPQIKTTTKNILILTFTGSLLATPIIYALFQYPTIDTYLIYTISILALFYLITLGKKQTTVEAQHKVYGFIILCLFALGFWTLYNLEPSLLSVFIKNNANKHLFGIQLTADAFFGFEALFIIMIGIFLTNLWLHLAKKNKDPSLAIKFGLALIFMGAGFLYLMLISSLHGSRHNIPALFIILSYAFFATGELFIGPLGISMVGKLSPEGKEGSLMGIWQLIVGVGAIASGWLAQQSIVNNKVDSETQRAAYTHLFHNLGLTIIVAGLLVLLASPWVKKLLGDK